MQDVLQHIFEVLHKVVGITHNVFGYTTGLSRSGNLCNPGMAMIDNTIHDEHINTK